MKKMKYKSEEETEKGNSLKVTEKKKTLMKKGKRKLKA